MNEQLVRTINKNKTGATGTICSDIVAKSPPDGYTLQVVPAVAETLPGYEIAA